MEEMSFFYEFLAKGIDAEDISYFHKSYEALLSQDALQVNSLNGNVCHFIFLILVPSTGFRLKVFG